MIDALGQPQSLLLLGGTSDIGLAIAEHYARGRAVRVVLAARPTSRRDAAAERLQRVGCRVEVVDFDALETTTHADVIDKAFSNGDVDVAVVAFGVLGSSDTLAHDPAAAADAARVNYVGAVSCGIALANAMRRQGHGWIVALSSVAGERVRKTNFVYGSTKAGMDGFYSGLGDHLHGTGVRVLVVRPGVVRTKMSAGMDDKPLTTTPEAVAVAVADGIGRRRSSVWVPTVFRWIMVVVRHLPRPLFRRLPF
ncbi:MAG: decaprenylphospho-beta-D-erythro-pentofuranosid-2-ulose 2-reductase [Acidimicrobiales bacterium]